MQELIKLEPAAFLALAPNERDLTDEQFEIVAQIAGGPPPALAMATDDEVRAIIGSLSGILKAARTSLDQGRLQLGLYRKALVGVISSQALKFAADRALSTLEWMPTPAELIRLSLDHSSPERMIYVRAVRLAADRRQRLFEARCKALADHTFPESELAALTRQELIHGLSERLLLQCNDGRIIYWTLEAWETDLGERRRAMSGPSRARDGEGGFGEL